MQEFQSGRGSSFQGEEANANPSDHCQRGENIAPATTSILLFRVSSIGRKSGDLKLVAKRVNMRTNGSGVTENGGQI